MLRSTFVSLCLGVSTAIAFSQAAPVTQRNRIAANPDLNPKTRLSGHVPTWAKAVNDAGPVPATTNLRVTFVLARSPDLQASFTNLLADQQDPASPTYHHWLTPQQIGALYGPTPDDIDAFTTWLTSQGLTVSEISPSRTFVIVEAPADTVANALATTFHNYIIRNSATGETTTHLAPTTDPAIPSAFANIIGSIAGIADIPVSPMNHFRLSPFRPANRPLPLDTSSDSTEHFISPKDFAIIYGLNPAYQQGITGTNQKVAVLGRSRIATSDISIFENLAGLPSNLPNIIVPSAGIDPGITNNPDQDEATLDVDRVIATAPGAQVDLVISSSASGGIETAAQYEVQTLMDPIMNISFGSCEAAAGTSGVNYWDSLFSQAAAEGISVLVSSGDSGAAACQPGGPVAGETRSINLICASSYATCIGGTEFADFADPQGYWSSTNNSGFQSALQYIPEGAWNEPTVITSSGTSIFVNAATGGGASTIISKPSWQTGAGVPADGFRDVPDISFSSSLHNGYFACLAYTGADCSNFFIYFGGTSVAAPSMAGIVAMLNQKTGTAQGNINPLLYRIAKSSPSAFHDATPQTSGVVICDLATPSMCNNSTPAVNALTGGLAGYSLSTGFDQATGLGSLNVANFLTAVTTPPVLTQLQIQIFTIPSTINSSQTAQVFASLGPASAGTITGTVQFFSNGVALGSPVPLLTQSVLSPPMSFPSPGSYQITARYLGDSNYAAATSSPVTLVVTTAPTATTTTTLTIASPTVPLNGSDIFTVMVAPKISSTVIPTGNVQFYQGNTALSSAIPLTAGSLVTYSMSAFALVGTATPITAVYLGDSNYLGSTSAPQPLTVTKQATSLALTPTYSTFAAGVSDTFTASVGFTSLTALGPTGTVQFFQGTTSMGTVPLISGKASSPPLTFPTAGTFSITAVYSGDTNFLGSTSSAASVTASSGAAYTLSASPASMSLTAGATSQNGTFINIHQINNFAGNVTLSCKVIYNGSNTVNYLPTCAFQSNFFPFPNGNPSSLLIIHTTAPRIAGSTLEVSSSSRSSLGVTLCTLLLCMVVPRRARILRSLSAIVCVFTLFASLTGCGGSTALATGGSGGGGSSGGGTVIGTTRGSYTVSIDAANNAGAAAPPTLTVALTVN